MCRMLLVRGEAPFDPAPHLAALAEIARTSKEYQGHGWGCAWRDDAGRWQLHHDIRPIWDDPTLANAAPSPTRLLLAHARSAFRDEGIAVENNMPFGDGERVFAFNGELRGVRIREQGRIGAEKIFNYIKRFDRGDAREAVVKGTAIIARRTRYVRAMNLLLASPSQAVASCHFGEDPDYFQLRRAHRDGLDIVCSQDYPGHGPWTRMDNGETLAFGYAT